MQNHTMTLPERVQARRDAATAREQMINELDAIWRTEHEAAEAEEIAWEAADAQIEAAQQAEAKAIRDGAKAVAQMIRTRKLATVADVIAALESNEAPGWVDVWCDLTTPCKGQYVGTEAAGEVVLDIEENYL